MRGGLESWKAFCGVTAEAFIEAFVASVEDDLRGLEREAAPGSFMLGAEESTRLIVPLAEGGELRVRVFPATADPLLRTMMSFRTAVDPLGDISVVKVTYPNEAEDAVTDLMARTIERLSRDPASVEHHPRFQFAPIAKWRIRRKWRRWRT